MSSNNELEWEKIFKDGEQATVEEPTSDHDEGSGKGAWSWGLRCLSKILVAAKGAATFQVVEFIKKHLGGTKLIFVVGETGTGKTSLLEEITGEKMRVGHTLKSGTQKYEIWPAIIHGQQYLFVDTPGFAAGDMDDMAIFEDIMNCLIAIGPFVKIAGANSKTIRWLQCFCGPEFYQNITFITTKWDELKQKALIKARGRLEDLKTSDFAPLLNLTAGYHGGYLYNHGIPGGGTEEIWSEPLDHEDDRPTRAAEASNLIHSRYGNVHIVELQIKKELDEGKKLSKTEAAKALTTLPTESSVIVAQKRAVLLRINEPARDDEGDDKDTACGKESEAQGPVFTEGVEEWFNVAKQMAIIFSKPELLIGAVGMAVGVVVEGVVSVCGAVWQAVTGWWSGPAPSSSS